jgi:hypothetical protein
MSLTQEAPRRLFRAFFHWDQNLEQPKKMMQSKAVPDEL